MAIERQMHFPCQTPIGKAELWVLHVAKAMPVQVLSFYMSFCPASRCKMVFPILTKPFVKR